MALVAQREFIAAIGARTGRSVARSPDDAYRHRRFLLAIVASLVAHGLFYFGIRHWSHQPHDVAVESPAIQLRLIDASPIRAQREDARVSSLTPQSPAPGTRVSVVAPILASASAARSDPLPAVAPGPVRIQESVSAVEQGVGVTMAIFDRQGRVIVPAASAEDPHKFGVRNRDSSFESRPMEHQSPLAYQPTRFDRYWKPDGETLLDEWVGKLSKEVSHDTKHGTRISCGAFLFLISCGWGHTPRVTIEELKAMRANPPAPRSNADDPYLPPIP